MRFIDRQEVARRLTYDVCIPIIRDAMIAFSRGDTRQLLRSIIPLGDGRMFGIISAVTEPFCETCNRIRLAATGRLHTCLALDDDVDLRAALRSGATDEALTVGPVQ